MDRRSFFRALAYGATAATFVTLDPERALWVPQKKLISIPRPRFDPRFLVRVKAGKPGYYTIPEGPIRLITEKLSGMELAVERISIGDWLLLARSFAGRPLKAVTFPDAYQMHPNGQGLQLWPVPAQDTVLAVEYFPMPPAGGLGARRPAARDFL